MDQSKALKEAMEDVTSVADQLRLLQQRTKDFGDTSENLKEVCDALVQVSKTIGEIQKPFSELLEKAEGVSKNAEEAAKELKARKNAIEKSGFGTSLKALYDSQDEMKDMLLGKIHEVSDSAKAVSTDVRSQLKTLDKITESINYGKKAVITFGLMAILIAVVLGYMIRFSYF